PYCYLPLHFRACSLHRLFVARQPPPPPSTLFPYTTLFRSRIQLPPYGAGKESGNAREAGDVNGARAGGDLRVGLGKGNGLLAKPDRKSTRLNSSHVSISYAVFCLKKKKT